MPAPARDPPSDLRQRYGVETPEHVEVQLELAGVGSRAAAALLDTGVLLVAAILIVVAAGFLADEASTDTGPSEPAAWAVALLILLYSFSIVGYFTLFEVLNGGRTPGKQALGIRVVMDTGRALTPAAGVVRNLVRLLDCYFPLAPALPGLILMAQHKSNKRLGDMAAGTIVVRDRPTDWTLGVVPAETEEPVETGPPELSEDEFRLLDRFLARLTELDAAVQVRMMRELVRRFERKVPRRAADPQEYLVQLFTEEQRRRRGRFATRVRAGAAGRTTVTAERFVARKRAGWEEFYGVARRVERSGVGGGAMPAGEIPGFAARYREVAADLARARTYQVDPRVIEYLERLVSAGHNALYRARGGGGGGGLARTPVLRYLLRDFPAAVVASWRYVGAAFLLFAAPAVAGYALLRERPQLADEMLSPMLVSRAEEAAERQARGVGYAEAPEEARPIVAAWIMSNNIRVAFWAFVGGMLAGTLTVWVLVTNGLMLGTVFALFANHGALGYLTTFVAGHGVLELTAIFISAGAGFRLARAIIAPGDLTRRDALVVEGRIAARMIGAVVTLLAIAGAIEGLISASDAAAELKHGVSAATTVFLGLYLLNGWRSLGEQGARSSS